MSDDAKARSSAAQSERWLAVCRHCSLRVDIPLSRHEPCSNGALHDWMRVKDEARSASPTPSVALRPHITACLDCISRDGRAWEPGAKMRGVACVGCGAGSWEREDVQRWTLADHGAARPTSAPIPHDLVVDQTVEACAALLDEKAHAHRSAAARYAEVMRTADSMSEDALAATIEMCAAYLRKSRTENKLRTEQAKEKP